MTWTEKSGFNLGTIEERTNVDIALPIAADSGTTIKKIAGELPPGVRIQDFSLVGVPFEVNRVTDFEFTLRATSDNGIADRTFVLTVQGEDLPQWITPPGRLNIGAQKFESFWLDTKNSEFGLYVTNGTSNFVQTQVDLYNGIPNRTQGVDGDYAFNLDNNQYYIKQNDRWREINDSVIKSVFGNDQQVVASIAVPNPNTVDFWLNLNSQNNGLDLRLRQYDNDRSAWVPVEYTVSETTPTAPFDQQIWLQSFPQQARFNLKIYNLAERQWQSFDYDFGFTPPDNTKNAFFILDNTPVDFDLEAIDSDLAAGDDLYYYIADGEGELPSGLELSASGKITGIVNPILALDAGDEPGYDLNLYDNIPLDFGVLDDGESVTPNKINRYFNFTVTVADDVNEIKRDFQIYVVSDDFLRADNTIMKSATGLFTADVTFLRKPLWLTPGYLGLRRADNFQTFFLEIFDPNSLLGKISYVLKEINDDGSASELPPGMSLDRATGEIFGQIPYQPAVTKQYRFTIEALRSENDVDSVEISANVFEDTLSGKQSLRIFKLPTGTQDNINDLNALVGQNINIENNIYKVVSVDDSNSNFDVLNLDRQLVPTYKAKPLTLIKDHSFGESSLYVSFDSLENSRDLEYWFPSKNTEDRTKLVFSSSEEYSIENVIPYIAWTITANSAGGVIEFNFDEAGINQVQDFETAIENYIDQVLLADTVYTSADCKINIVSQDLIYLELPRTAKTLNRSLIEKPFHMEDSTAIDVFKGGAELSDAEFWQVFLDTGLTRSFTTGKQLALAIAKATTITQRINVSDTEVISNIKTFTVDILGNVDSTINWQTPSVLPDIEANRVSYLSLKATTTLVGSNIKYNIVKGKLPNGLELKRNGEITGRVNQFPADPVLYKGIFKNDRLYQQNDLIRVDNDYYKCIKDYPVDTFFDVSNTEYWQSYDLQSNKGLTYIDRNYNQWILGYDYTVGDIVEFADISYKCVQDHTASSNNRPDQDTDSVFWQVLQQTTVFDSGTSSFDRVFTFTALARDNFGYSADTKEFVLTVRDVDQRVYTNVYMKPLLKKEQRRVVESLVNNFNVFSPDLIYRPYDRNFGIQKDLKTLVYAGIEQREVNYFAAATVKNHRRKRFNFGEVKTAVAKQPGSNQIVYEVVYVDLIDPQEPGTGTVQERSKIKTKQSLKINQVKLETKDDSSLEAVANDTFVIQGRTQTVNINAVNGGFNVVTKNAENIRVGNNGQVGVILRDLTTVTFRSSGLNSTVTNSVDRYRPKNTVITADTTAHLASQNKDQFRYISNISNMRKRIENIGINERQFLPLWMRTSQQGDIQQIDYVTAIPLCYCKPGTSETIKENIENFIATTEFSFNRINYEIDRYIVEGTESNPNDQYILFGNYKHNI